MTDSGAPADEQILTFLHSKNQEEVMMGRLAQEKGDSVEARRYGERLERDHQQNDIQLRSIASSLGITLANDMDMDGSNVNNNNNNNNNINNDRGMRNPPRGGDSELRNLSGPEFDRAFGRMMQAGHREVISRVESSMASVSNNRVKQFLRETLPALREHESTAAALAGSTSASAEPTR